MNIVFLGGTETVTGSKFLLESGNTRVLVDCGLFQGYKWLRRRNWEPLPLDIAKLDAVVLTHAHLDHSGYVPRLYQQGYRGPVFCHKATRDLCAILLADSGHLQEEDARFLGRHKLSKHEKPEPLYDRQTAERSMELFETVNFAEEFAVGEVRFRLQPSGHILGAASVIAEAEGKYVGFSGDVGRWDDIMMYPPKPLPELDLLLMESTYGDRAHAEADTWEQLAQIVNETVSRGGVLMIPSFAVGRAQVLQHLLAVLMEQKRIPALPVFLDSPMAIDVSGIYQQYADQHRLDAADCARMTKVVKYVQDVDESKALADLNYPHIIIAGSGMISGGRILHHMKRLMPGHRNTLLLTGHQAGGTRGAHLKAGAETVKIHGQYVPCKAQVAVLDGLSGHGDYRDLARWLQLSNWKKETPIQLVHGEPDAADSLRLYLKDQYGYRVDVGEYRSILRL